MRVKGALFSSFGAYWTVRRFMNISRLCVKEVKLFRAQHTVCPRYRKLVEKQIAFYWPTKEGKRVNLLPEALCTCVLLFPVSEREEQEGQKRDRKSTQGSNDNKQITQERRSL